MVDPVTTNKSLAQPPNAADPGTWDQPMNNNAGALDVVLGGLTQLNATGLTGVQPPLSLAQYRPCNIVVTGTPSGNVTYVLPAGVGGFYFFQNNTSGAPTVSLGSASGGAVVTVPQGDCAVIVVDPTYGARRGDSIDTEAAGGPGQVQYADPGTGNFSGAAGMIYTASTQALALGGPLSVTGNFTLVGQVMSRLITNGGANTPTLAIPFAGVGMTLDCSKTNVFSTTLTGNVTSFAISNQGDGQTLNWLLAQDGTGNRTISWPGNFHWPGGTPGVLSTTHNVMDLLVATYVPSVGWLANLIKGFV